MAKDLTHEVFQPKVIKCRCGAVIGRTEFHNQVLILESGITLFNYACWLCGSCKKFYNSWLAPLLPGERADDCPDIGEIQHRALSVKEKAHKLGYRRKEKHPGEYQQQQRAVTDF